MTLVSSIITVIAFHEEIGGDTRSPAYFDEIFNA